MYFLIDATMPRNGGKENLTVVEKEEGPAGTRKALLPPPQDKNVRVEDENCVFPPPESNTILKEKN